MIGSHSMSTGLTLHSPRAQVTCNLLPHVFHLAPGRWAVEHHWSRGHVCSCAGDGPCI